jgi:hypothetical protein
VDTPDVDTSDVDAPDADTPEVYAPLAMPRMWRRRMVDAPKVDAADLEAPELDDADVEAPVLDPAVLRRAWGCDRMWPCLGGCSRWDAPECGHSRGGAPGEAPDVALPGDVGGEFQ